jgi:hypothetical protein
MWEKILGDFSGGREPVRIFLHWNQREFHFRFTNFTLRTVSIEQIIFVNQGMGVSVSRKFLAVQHTGETTLDDT